MTGFTGGLFGAVSLPIELPLTTTLMLRSIADIAGHHGEDLTKLEGRAADTAVPIPGAIRGATLNVLFMEHFEKVANGHFALRQLEREHGWAAIIEVAGTIGAQGR